MSDQSLRDALEELVADRENTTSVAHQDYVIAPYELRELLAAHSAPAQVEITDEAVAAGADRHRMDGHSMLGCGSLSSTEQTVRGVLEAALPLLGPLPLLDRDEVASAVVEAAVDFAGSSGSPDDCNAAVKPAVDTILELARPMPTREQIEQAVAAAGIGSYRTVVTEAVLALLNGSKS